MSFIFLFIHIDLKGSAIDADPFFHIFIMIYPNSGILNIGE